MTIIYPRVNLKNKMEQSCSQEVNFSDWIAHRHNTYRYLFIHLINVKTNNNNNFTAMLCNINEFSKVKLFDLHYLWGNSIMINIWNVDNGKIRAVSFLNGEVNVYGKHSAFEFFGFNNKTVVDFAYTFVGTIIGPME